MVLLALGAGQHRVVVGDHGAPCVLVVEPVAVDASRSADESVCRGALDQLFDAATPALGGDGEPAVLGNALRIAQVVDVLAGRPPPLGVSTFHHVWPAGIGQQATTDEELGQIGADVVEVDLLDRHRQPVHGLPFLDHGQRVTHRHQTPEGHTEVLQGAAHRRAHHMLHLHRLEHDHDRPGSQGITWCEREQNHGALQRGHQCDL